MAKYIDADRLRAEIERKIHEISHPLKDGYEVQSIGKIEGLSELLEIIDSLQQEQPDSPSLTERSIVWFENIAANAKRLSAGNVSHLGPTIVGMAIRSKEFLEKHKQDQPEVDLEKAAQHVYESWMGGTMDDVRRDMVELGRVLNARKV